MGTKSACVFKTEYHLVWCVKYRRKILVYPEIDLRLKEILYDIQRPYSYVDRMYTTALYTRFHTEVQRKYFIPIKKRIPYN